MIPKIIHYCWFSNDEMSDQAKRCIDSWKKWLPDYKIRKWTLEDFNADSTLLTKEALATKKWAFLTDYVRHYALYHNGGIYMDSDVMLYGDITTLLDAEFVSACEYHPNQEAKSMLASQITENGVRICKSIKIGGIGVQAAFMASCSNHPLTKKILEYYNTLDLNSILQNRYTAPTVIAYCMEEYGYRYVDEEQHLNGGIHLYPTQLISNYDQKNKQSLVVHWCAGSWTNRTMLGMFKHKLNQFSLYRKLRDYAKSVCYS